MINFWCKLSIGKPDKIASTLFQIIKEQQARGSITSTWLTFINTTLNECGLGYLLHTPPEALNPKHVKLIVRDRTSAIDSQDWHSQVMESGHCLNHRIFKTDRQFENYFTLLHRKEALQLCRFRCGNHKLPITTGRNNQTEKSKRICPLCNSNKIGDEFHYIFQCPAFHQERSAHIDPKFTKKTNILHMESLFKTKDTQTCSNLARFCSTIMNNFREPTNRISKVRKGRADKQSTTKPAAENCST